MGHETFMNGGLRGGGGAAKGRIRAGSIGLLALLLLSGCYHLGGDCCFNYECACGGAAGAGGGTTSATIGAADTGNPAPAKEAAIRSCPSGGSDGGETGTGR